MRMLAVRLVDVADVDCAHEANFCVIEDMAMEHPRSGPVQLDEKTLRRIDRHVDRVLPGTRAQRNALLIHFLKEEPVQMDGMRPDRLVRNRPQLFLTYSCTHCRLPPERPSLERESRNALRLGHDQ